MSPGRPSTNSIHHRPSSAARNPRPIPRTSTRRWSVAPLKSSACVTGPQAGSGWRPSTRSDRGMSMMLKRFSRVGTPTTSTSMPVSTVGASGGSSGPRMPSRRANSSVSQMPPVPSCTVMLWSSCQVTTPRIRTSRWPASAASGSVFTSAIGMSSGGSSAFSPPPASSAHDRVVTDNSVAAIAAKRHDIRRPVLRKTGIMPSGS